MREVQWEGSSLDELRTFPDEVQKAVGYALFFAQVGLTHEDAKPLKGFKGAGGLEVIERHDGDTYRVRVALLSEEEHARRRNVEAGHGSHQKTPS